MKVQITDYLNNLQDGDIERLLSYYNIDGKIKCNLNNAIIIEAEEDAFEYFHLTTPMFWPQISYLIYETTSLYWFLQQINPNIITNCFAKVEAPNHIKYLPNALRAVNFLSE